MKLNKITCISLVLVLFTLLLTACNTSSPKNSLQAICTAAKNKDLEMYKKHLSTRLLAQMQDEAIKSKQGIDDVVKAVLNDTHGCPEPLQTRGENIDGNNAEIYVSDELGHWNKMRLVKEDGVWRLDGQ